MDGCFDWEVVDGCFDWEVVDGYFDWEVVDGCFDWEVVDGCFDSEVVDGCFDSEVVDSQRYICDKSLLFLTDFVFNHMSISLVYFLLFSVTRYPPKYKTN